MNWINIKDQLPKVEKAILFIEKYKIDRLEKNNYYALHIGWFDDSKRYFVSESEKDWYGDNEHVTLDNIICWTYYNAENIAQENENEYYKDKQ